MDPDGASRFEFDSGDGRVGKDLGSIGRGAARVREGQAGIVGQKLVVENRAAVFFRGREGFARGQILGVPDLVTFVRRNLSQFLECPHGGAKLGHPGGGAGREKKGCEARKVGRDASQDLTFGCGFSHESDVTVGEVAETPVNHF